MGSDEFDGLVSGIYEEELEGRMPLVSFRKNQNESYDAIWYQLGTDAGQPQFQRSLTLLSYDCVLFEDESPECSSVEEV